MATPAVAHDPATPPPADPAAPAAPGTFEDKLLASSDYKGAGVVRDAATRARGGEPVPASACAAEAAGASAAGAPADDTRAAAGGDQDSGGQGGGGAEPGGGNGGSLARARDDAGAQSQRAAGSTQVGRGRRGAWPPLHACACMAAAVAGSGPPALRRGWRRGLGERRRARSYSASCGQVPRLIPDTNRHPSPLPTPIPPDPHGGAFFDGSARRRRRRSR